MVDLSGVSSGLIRRGMAHGAVHKCERVQGAQTGQAEQTDARLQVARAQVVGADEPAAPESPVKGWGAFLMCKGRYFSSDPSPRTKLK